MYKDTRGLVEELSTYDYPLTNCVYAPIYTRHSGNIKGYMTEVAVNNVLTEFGAVPFSDFSSRKGYSFRKVGHSVEVRKNGNKKFEFDNVVYLKGHPYIIEVKSAGLDGYTNAENLKNIYDISEILFGTPADILCFVKYGKEEIDKIERTTDIHLISAGWTSDEIYAAVADYKAGLTSKKDYHKIVGTNVIFSNSKKLVESNNADEIIEPQFFNLRSA